MKKLFFLIILVLCPGCFTIGTIMIMGSVPYTDRIYEEKGMVSYDYVKDFGPISGVTTTTLNDLYKKNPQLKQDVIMQKFFSKDYLDEEILWYYDDSWRIGKYRLFVERPVFCPKGIYIYTTKTRKCYHYWKYPVLGVCFIAAAPLDLVTFPLQILLGVEPIKVSW